MNPQFPIYIPSRGRYTTRLTMKALDTLKVPYKVVVEEDEYAKYCEVIEKAKILVLDKWYQRTYVTCDVFGTDVVKGGIGAGPARNFMWDHAIGIGAEYHWMLDDNIRAFSRNNKKVRIKVADGTIFRCMEDFALRYENVALAGPTYQQFRGRTPFIVNSLVYNCMLIRNDLPLRWRGRYNEDIDLTLRAMKAGWCTILFRAFMQEKMLTMTMAGGCTDVLYKDGTLKKSMMTTAQHPDVCKLVYRFNRWHQRIDYSKFKHLKLIRRHETPCGINNYGMTLEAV
jgi:hypothetical protein